MERRASPGWRAVMNPGHAPAGSRRSWVRTRDFDELCLQDDGGPALEVVEGADIEEVIRERQDQPIPAALPVLPLREIVPFPDTLTPLAVGRPRSMRLINDVLSGERMLALVASKNPEEEDPGPDELYDVGVAGIVARMLKVPDGTIRILVQGTERIRIADFVAEEPYLVARVEQLADVVEPSPGLEVVQLGSKIQSQVQSEIDKGQREYYLREQLKAIQQELGEGDEQQAEINELRERIEAANLPEDARKQADRELGRLERLPPAAAEYGVIRTYLEWLVELPWGVTTDDDLDIPHAREVLDADHYDLERVKDRILEYLAVRTLNPESPGPILCFVGPPGVGKTSLGRSIAKANTLDPVPPALQDRMEVIQLAGYTVDKKLHIAKRYLVPRQISQNGLQRGQISFADPAIKAIIDEYTREAGVRNLEREIGSICRKIARQIAEGELKGKATISAKRARQLLGKRRFFAEQRRRTKDPGVATGLAWTPVGGEVLFVEATAAPGDGKLTITGQLGEVMKESAQAALSWVRGHVRELGADLPEDWFATNDIHIHVPAGAVPKDGPSAGVAMAVALASLVTRKPVSSDVAMTGEITLTGQVLPIGGLKEKALAAQRAGIKRVIVPARNEGDVAEIPQHQREGLEFIHCETIEDALAAAL